MKSIYNKLFIVGLLLVTGMIAFAQENSIPEAPVVPTIAPVRADTRNWRKSFSTLEEVLKEQESNVKLASNPILRSIPARDFSSYSTGAIPIDETVSPTGGRIYSVPITTASGWHLTPDISLIYNSQSGNNVAGFGWSVSGLSSIIVRNGVQHYDGQNNGAIYDATDAKYSLDGIPLVQSEVGFSGYSLATARGNVQVQKHQNQSGQALYFTVLYPNGTSATFGFTDNTQPRISYPITEFSDLYGNTISFSYAYYDGYYYISRIEFGVDASIEFTYTTRSDNSPYMFAQAGLCVSFPDRLLKTITSKDGNSVICQYSLIHELSDSVSLLKEIHCTSGTSELPPLLFEYGVDSETGGTPSFSSEYYDYFPTYFSNSATSPVLYKRGKLLPGSLDDCVVSLPSLNTYAKIDSTWHFPAGYYYKYGSKYAANQQILCNFTGNNSFSQSIYQQVLLAEEGFQLIEAIDVDLDGVDELVKINNSSSTAGVTDYKITVYNFVSYNSFSSYDFTVSVNDGTHNNAYNNPVKSYYRFGNFRGDGKPLLLIMTRNASKFVLVDINGRSKVSETTLFTNGDEEENLVLAADFENDGKEDLCHITTTGMDVYSLATVTSTTFSLRTTYSGISRSLLYTDPCYLENGIPQEVKSVLYKVDINNDGYLDIASAPDLRVKIGNNTYHSNTWNIARFNGKQFYTETQSLVTRGDKDSIVFLDVDKDGLPDMLHHFGSYLFCFLNTNGKFSYPYNYIQMELPGDSELVTGDCSLFWHAGDIYVVSGPIIRLYECSVDHTGRRSLSALSDSFGVLHTNQYKSTNTLSGAYLIDNTRSYTSSNGYKRIRMPLSVLFSSNRYMNNTLNISSECYTYWDMVYHTRGKGFCGFGKVLVTDYTNNVNTATILNPEKLGIAEQIAVTKNYMGTPYYTVVNTYDNNSSTYGRLNPRLTSCAATDSLTGIETTTTYTYGSYDFPTDVLTSRRIGSGTAKTEQVTRLYEHSVTPSKYVLGVVKQESVVREGDGSDTFKWKEKSVYTYDQNYRPLTYKKYVGRFGTIEPVLPPRPPHGAPAGRGDGQDEPESNRIVVDTSLVIIPGFEHYDATNLISETHWQYDTHGNVIYEKVAPYGATEFTGSTYTYDINGRYLTSKTNALGRTITYNSYNKFGQPEVIVNDRNQSTYYTFDDWGNEESVTCPDGTVEQITTAWGGSGLYTATSTVTGRPESVAHYDALGREIRSGVKRFNGQWQWVDKEYNAKGLLSRTSLPYRGTSASYWNTYSYDDYNRPLLLTEASGEVSSWSYSGTSTTTVKDGITSTRTTDANGNTISVTDDGGTITYALRDDGQPSKVTVPGNVSTTFTYDDYGRRTKIVDPSAGTQTDDYLWNSDGSSKVTHTGPNGSVKTYRDKYGRTTLIERVGEYNTTYTYDTYGRLSTEQSTNGTEAEYGYDNYDRVVTAEETALDGKWFRKVYGYGAGSIITSVQYINQSGTITTENYTYANGHNTGITLTDGTVVWSLSGENDLGMPTSITTGTITREYGYTAFGLPSYRKMDGGNLQHYTYQFNVSTGNLISRSDVLNCQTELFDYDGLNRLTDIGDRQISYANNGNILSIDGVGTMTYGSTTRPYRLTSLTPEEDGLVPNRQQSVSYTCYNRPSILTEGGRSAAFTYNGDGDRVKMSVADSTGNVLTRYYIGGRYEYDQTPSGTKERLYLGGDAYSAPMVYQRENNGGWTAYNIGRDYLGNITHIATTSGTLVAEYSYDPWGRLRDPETLDIYAAGYEPELFLGRGFTGHEHLTWFGLVNMNARLYDPLLGRFLSPDPYVQAPDFTQNFNRYSYALNNPLRYTDETGEYTFIDDALAGVIGGTVNWVTNGCKFTWEGLGYFGIGAAIGVASLYVSPVFMSGVMEAANSIIRQGRGEDGRWSMDNVKLEIVLMDGAMGLATSYISGELSSVLENSLKTFTSRLPGKAWEGLVNRGLTGAGSGFILGFGIAALNQWGQYQESGYYDWDAVWKGGWKACLTGLATGSICGMAEGIKEARSNYKNPWNGKDWYPNNQGFEGVSETGVLQPGIYDRYGDDSGSYLAPEGTPFEQRSLPSYKNDESLYTRYRVVKPISDVKIGTVAPWFGYPGGGTQYYLPNRIQYYIDNGFIIKL